MQTVKKSGTLSEISCPRLLAHLHLIRFDGTLRLTRGALLKLLYFQGGEIAMASSNDQADHLAPILIRAGKLKPEQMDLARKSTRPGVSLARVLVQMGFLTSGELFAGARQQLRQIVGSVLPLTDAGYEIQGGFFPREITSLNVDTRELLLDLIRDLSDRSFVLLEVGAPDTVYLPATGGNGEGAPLPRRWKDLIERFPHPMAIRDFGQAAGLDDFSASKVVYGLSLLGRLAPEHPSEEIAEASMAPSVVEEVPLQEEASVPVEPETPGFRDDSVRIVPILAGDGAGDGATADAPEKENQEDAAQQALPPQLPQPISPAASFSMSPASGEEPIPVETATDGAAAHVPLSNQPRETPTADEDAAMPSILSSEETPASEPSRTTPPSLKPIREEMPFPRPALPRSEPSRPWTILSILSGLILLALVGYWFVFLRAPSSGDGPSVPPAGEAAVQDDASAAPDTSGTMPAAVPATQDHVASAPANPAPEAASPDVSRASSPQPETTAPAGNDATSQVEEKPAASDSGAKEAAQRQDRPPAPPAAATPPATAATTASTAPRPEGTVASAAWTKARAQLDSGEHAAAARAWSEALRADSSSFTLQIAIACQDDSLRKAAHGTRPGDPFFVTPFLLQGRSCFRLCFGVYPSIAQAEAAAGSLPAVLAEGGAHPVVIALRKVIAPEKR